MKNLFSVGDKKNYIKTVGHSDIASFDNGTVHEVFSTFSIARYAEWCCRLFVLEMKESDEEGIGTFVTVNHTAPALVGSEIAFEATISELRGNTINCTWVAKHGDRVIAEGTQGQKIIKKDKLAKIFKDLEQHL
jgi:fluoroacetyl-CoA thioesterase